MKQYSDKRNGWAEGMWVREVGPDTDCVREQRREYGSLVWRGHRVLDLGANIGAFAWFALMHGAERVTCVEPDPGNIQVLDLNLQPFSASTVRIAAAVANDPGQVELYLANNDQHWSHSTVPTKGREPVSVPAVAMAPLLPGHTAVKCDIEGAEYGIDWSFLAASDVSMVAMELHLNRGTWRTEECPRLFKVMADAGFTINDEFIPEKHWNMVRTWQR